MRAFLDRASKLYYEGTPLLSDAEFDLLAEKHNYNTVGYEVTDAVPHTYQMYSLQKFFDITKAPALDGYVRTPKLDGAAVSVLYIGGELQLGLTRGDGIHGRDITDKMQHLVPNTIKYLGVVQITGEVIAPSSVPNSRNFASGSLNLKSMEEFRYRPLTFVAYDVQGENNNTWREAMGALNTQGFNTVNKFDASDYPTDGMVYRVDSYKTFKSLGFTAKHPRGAFALKEQIAGVETTLLEVVWQLGKSGVVSPVAILDPCIIGEATVSRATLHNIEYIRDLNLELGCKVEVIRSGEIIPRVVRRLD